MSKHNGEDTSTSDADRGDADASATTDEAVGRADITDGLREAAMFLGEDSQGRSMFLAPYDEGLAEKAAGMRLKQQTDTDPEPQTPDPTDDDVEFDKREGGPIRRFNDVFTDLGSVNLEALGLDGYEVATAAATLRDEMYRNNFPLIEPSFALKCDDCETEYQNADLAACPECTEQAMADAEFAQPGAMSVEATPESMASIPEQFHAGDLRDPSEEQKDRIDDIVDSVNKEGQSLRDLMKLAEDDQARLGVSTIVVKWKYAIATEDLPGVHRRGDVMYKRPDELMRADPKRLVPVVNEDGRIGDYWWTCPIHRDTETQKHGGHCEECGTQLREVYFVELDNAKSTQVEKFYFEDEVITWARYFPRLHGLDGLSPMHLVWLKQSILHWMDVYGAAYYDPQSDRYPNKMMVVHTTNREAWEKNFQQASDEAKENPYANQILVNEYATESRSTPEVQIIDLMSDELLGQNDELRQQYKKDIRALFGVSNVHENDMEDAGGLNNEGLQLEVTDRAISSAMKDTAAGPLKELTEVLDITDYEFAFVPSQANDTEEMVQKIQAGTSAAQAGLTATWEDDEVEIADGAFQAQQQGMGMGGMMGGAPGGGGAMGGPGGAPGTEAEMGMDDLFGSPSQAPDYGPDSPTTPAQAPESTFADYMDAWLVDEKAVGDDEWSGKATVFRVLADPDDDTEYNGDVLGMGIDFPESGVYVDWRREAFPDQLDEPHVSEYGSLADLEQATGNVVEQVDPGGGDAEGVSEKADFLSGEGRSEALPDGFHEGLKQAFTDALWDEIDMADSKAWDAEDEVGRAVRKAVHSVIRFEGGVFDDIKGIGPTGHSTLEDILEDELTNDSWSVGSVASRLRQSYGWDEEKSTTVAGTEIAHIMNNAREKAIRYDPERSTEALFYWDGPEDFRTTECCSGIKQETSPIWGGEPKPLDDLIAIERKYHNEYFPSLRFRKHLPHINCRHTFVQAN